MKTRRVGYARSGPGSAWAKVGVVATGTMLLAACGSTSSPSATKSTGSSASSSSAGSAAKPVTITFDAMEYSAAAQKYFPKFAKEFEAKNPNIHVNVKVINWSQGLQTLDTEIGAGHAPNVAIIGTRWLPAFEHAGILEPIPKVIPQSFLGHFYSGALSALKYKGTIYSLPEAASVRLLVYNKSLFAKAGIASAPTTWNQLLADAIAIHKKTGAAGYGLTGSHVETSLGYWYAMWGFGGHLLNASHTKGALTSKPDVAALTMLDKLIKQGGAEVGVTAATRTNLETQFYANKVAMMIDGPWLPARAEKDGLKVGITNMPHQPGVPVRNVAIEDSWVIFKKGSSAQRKASAAFSQFMFSSSVRTSFNKTEHFLPVGKTDGSKPVFKGNPVLKYYLKAFAGSTVAEPIVPKFSAISLDVTKAVQSVYAGSTTPRSALATANSAVNTALAGG